MPNRRSFRRAISRALNNQLETLDRRVLLCADPHNLANVPDEVAGMFDGGHITAQQYASLAPEIQAQIDPHQISDSVDQPPIDYDAVLGIPLHPDGPPAGEDGEADNLPDFFPGLTGSVSVDQTSQSGRTLLRFGTRVHNQGTGPASLISGRPGVDSIPTGAPITSWVNPDGSQNVLQGVYTWNGSSFVLSYYRAAGRFTYHSGHGHFHFDGYAFYRLRARNGDGTPGAYITRGDGTEVVGTKTGFCLINTTSSFTMENGQSSTTLPTYNGSGQPTMSCGLMQGVRVGQADDYSSSLEGQWIDVTGVPNGQYFIEISLDGENAVLEANEANNAKSFAYTLNVNNPGGGVPADQFDTGTNNNSLAAAADFGVLGTFTQTGLSIHYGQDFDWFKFEASSTGTYTISTIGTSGNLDLYLFDSAGQQLRASTGTASNESVSYPFEMGQTYYVKTEGYNSTQVTNYQIAWALKPTVTNSVDTLLGSEVGAAPASVVIARNGPTTSPLTITFSVGGTAERDVDYTIEADGLISPNTISIGDLQSTVTVWVRPIADNVAEPTETVIITVNNSSVYVIGGSASAEVRIADAPPQVVASNFAYDVLPHRVIMDFSTNVGASLDLTDLVVTDLDRQQNVAVGSVTYGDNRNRGTFSFASVLPDGNYRAVLGAAGVTHAFGLPLAGDAVVDFFVFAGDANRDRSVNIADFAILAGNFNTAASFVGGDFDYDGSVGIGDFSILASKFNTTLPEPAPARAALQPANLPVVPGVPFSARAIGSVAGAAGLLDDAKVI